METFAPPIPPPPPCQHVVKSRTRKIKSKRRPKFGVLWLLATLFTGGLALILYIIWPRHKEVVAIDRWAECSVCGQRW